MSADKLGTDPSNPNQAGGAQAGQFNTINQAGGDNNGLFIENDPDANSLVNDPPQSCYPNPTHTNCYAGHYQRKKISPSPTVVPCVIFDVKPTRDRVAKFIDQMKSQAQANFKNGMILNAFLNYLDIQKKSLDPTNAPAGMIKSTKDAGEVGIPSSVGGVPTTDTSASAMVVALESKIASNYVVFLRIDASLANITLTPTPTSAQVLNFPDPAFDYFPGRYLKDPNSTTGALISGATNADKLHNYVSAMVERMVRTFLSGSKQMARDTGGPYSAPGPGQPTVDIQGYYQGMEPDMLHAVPSGSSGGGDIIYLNSHPQAYPCGIADPVNDTLQHFKFPDGTYQPEVLNQGAGTVISHLDECPAPGVAYKKQGNKGPTVEGIKVMVGMMLMKQMINGISGSNGLKQGAIIAPDAYGNITDACKGAGYATWITQKRKQDLAVYQDILNGMKASGTAAADIKLDCPDLANGTGSQDASAQAADGGVSQTRACTLAALMTYVDNMEVVQYAYCTWHTVWDSARRAIDRGYLNVQNDAPRGAPAPWFFDLSRPSSLTAWASTNDAGRDSKSDDSFFLISLSLGGGIGAARRKRNRRRKNRALAGAAAGFTAALLAVQGFSWFGASRSTHADITFTNSSGQTITLSTGLTGGNATCGGKQDGGGTFSSDDDDESPFHLFTDSSGSKVRACANDSASGCDGATVMLCDFKCGAGSPIQVAHDQYDKIIKGMLADTTLPKATRDAVLKVQTSNDDALHASMKACEQYSFNVHTDQDSQQDDGDASPDGTTTAAQTQCLNNSRVCDPGAAAFQAPQGGKDDPKTGFDSNFPSQQAFSSAAPPAGGKGSTPDAGPSGNPGDGTNTLSSQGQNASAGGIIPDGSKGSGGGGSFSGNGGPNGGGSGRGGGAPGGTNSGDSLGLGGLKTSADPDSNAASAGGVAAAGAGGGGFSSGSGAGGGGGGGGGSRYGGGGSISADGTGASSLAFGQSGGSGDGSALAPGVTDPADYFTRIGLNDSLFKIVEKQYRSKAIDWAKPPAGKPAAP